ncbi:hypothetical protein IID62_01295 [candidate division KSB1 bacterium]|nr:hypothetical protein [candidate division KSB1 bacterium]
MAAPLSQDEIDALLGDTDALDDSDPIELEADIAEEGSRKTGSKNIGIRETKPFRFDFSYRSPILKSNDYVFNPNLEEKMENSTVVVRTISNYSTFLRKKDN